MISNLVGHLLDARLARLAKTHKCTYSRYVDDITFSTSQKDFPSELAAPVTGSKFEWQLCAELRNKIERSGFRINDKKTRIQFRGSRQVTTGDGKREGQYPRGVLADSAAYVPRAFHSGYVLPNGACAPRRWSAGRSSYTEGYHKP